MSDKKPWGVAEEERLQRELNLEPSDAARRLCLQMNGTDHCPPKPYRPDNTCGACDDIQAALDAAEARVRREIAEEIHDVARNHTQRANECETLANCIENWRTQLGRSGR